MLINELSKRTGISIYTLRYYENLGLLNGQVKAEVKSNNYKYYQESDIAKLEMIKGSKEAGFTLSEIKELLITWYSPQMGIPEKIAVVSQKMEEVDSKIAQLKRVKKLLKTAIEDIQAGLC